MFQTFNGKKVVDWLFRFGDLNAHDIKLLSDEREAARRRSIQAARAPGARETAKVARREAGKKRRRLAWHQNRARK